MKSMKIFFYVIVAVFGGYLMIFGSDNQNINNKSLAGLMLFIIGFLAFVRELAKIYFAKKIVEGKKNTEPIDEKTME